MTVESLIDEIKQTTIQEFGKESTAKTKRYFNKANKRIAKIQNGSICYENFEQFIKGCKTFKTPALFDGMEFSDYTVENDSQKNAVKGVIDYLSKCEINFLTGVNLILLGNFGTGKTMLMSILCNKLGDRAFGCKFFSAVDMICRIKDSFAASSKMSTTEVLETYKQADFLFIDDIDKIKPTEYVQELMYSLVNDRIENERPIIISANHTLEELDEQFFGEATVSRLAAKGKSKTIKFTHNNKRVS